MKNNLIAVLCTLLHLQFRWLHLQHFMDFYEKLGS